MFCKQLLHRSNACYPYGDRSKNEPGTHAPDLQLLVSISGHTELMQAIPIVSSCPKMQIFIKKILLLYCTY